MITILSEWLQRNRQKVIVSSFVLLFAIRLIAGILSASSQENTVPYYRYLYLLFSIVLITVVIWASRNELSNLNVDKYVLYSIVLSGILLFLMYGFSILGIAALMCALFVGWASRSQAPEFHKKRHFSQVFLYVSLGIAPVILIRLFAPEFYRIYNYYLELSIGGIFILVSIIFWDVIFEEILFRGMLWGILREWKSTNNKIVITQAVLFWIVHSDLIRGASFGFTVLTFGIWVGFLVLRSKSLMPSIATHLVHNFTSQLL